MSFFLAGHGGLRRRCRVPWEKGNLGNRPKGGRGKGGKRGSSSESCVGKHGAKRGPSMGYASPPRLRRGLPARSIHETRTRAPRMLTQRMGQFCRLLNCPQVKHPRGWRPPGSIKIQFRSYILLCSKMCSTHCVRLRPNIFWVTWWSGKKAATRQACV